MAPYSSILPCKIPRTEELGWLQSKGSQKAGHDRAHMHACLFPLQDQKSQGGQSSIKTCYHFPPCSLVKEFGTLLYGGRGRSLGSLKLFLWSVNQLCTAGHDCRNWGLGIGQPVLSPSWVPSRLTVGSRRGWGLDGLTILCLLIREAWCAAVHGSQRVEHNWATELMQFRLPIYITFFLWFIYTFPTQNSCVSNRINFSPTHTHRVSAYKMFWRSLGGWRRQ